MSGKFYRTLTEEGDTERVSGTLYLQPGQNFFLEVTTPVHQIVTLRAETLILYYPERQLAFKLRSSLQMLPLGSQVFALNEQDLLKQSGFVFLNREARGDTTWSFWSHPQEHLTLKLGTVQNRLVRLTLENTEKQRIFFQVVVNEYREIQPGLWFPSSIQTLDATTATPIIEKVAFRDLRLTSEVPHWVQSFVLPPQTEVRIRGWSE